jgi:hypothetical protein
LADLLAGLSRPADLGFGLPMGMALRSSVLATRVAQSLGLATDETRAAFHSALLHHVGCPGSAHETAVLFGDYAAAPVIQKCTGKLAAADVYTASTAFLLLDSVRLDLGVGSQIHP